MVVLLHTDHAPDVYGNAYPDFAGTGRLQPIPIKLGAADRVPSFSAVSKSRSFSCAVAADIEMRQPYFHA